MHAVNRSTGTRVAGRIVKADTFWKRFRGLRGRRALPAGEALWIVPCRGIHTRGMAFPIDVVFLDRSGRVVGMEENLPPGRFAPIRWKARTVLELPAGALSQSGTGLGDLIEIHLTEEP
jgi:uncharacterized membrane protein (UPF0127 family)